MKINNEILELSTIFDNLLIGEILEYHKELLTIKSELNFCLEILREDSTDMDERLNEMMDIDQQLGYVDANIKVLENAILCHESKVFEKRTINNRLTVLCLN